MGHFILNLPDDLHKKFKVKSIEEEISMQQILRELIQKYIDGEVKVEAKIEYSYVSWKR